MLLLALLSSGCATKTCDARGPAETCEVHSAFMDSVTFPYEELPMPSRGYIEARVQYFPHAHPFLLPKGCSKCVCFVCDECVRAESSWLKDHPLDNR